MYMSFNLALVQTKYFSQYRFASRYVGNNLIMNFFMRQEKRINSVVRAYHVDDVILY